MEKNVTIAPLIPMLAVTGHPTRERIRRHLEMLTENGIGQALIYPRSGCEVDYLSEEWFRVIRFFLEEAEALGMRIWLYDDFNWPSGDAGGRVTAYEPYRLQAITVRGERMGQIGCHSRHNAALFGEKYFPDLLSEEAVSYFIRCTHEEYYRRFGQYFGRVILGIFTDEPSIGYCTTAESIPYYEGMEADYAALSGRDFYTDMETEHGEFYPVALEVISRRFRSCYVDKLVEWCHSRGIRMTGHLLNDNSPFGATKHGGHFLKTLAAFALPGVDELATCFEDPSQATLLGAAEYAGRARGAMAELFALGPCDISYAKRRCMLYLAACHKIDHYFLAISPLDLRGNRLVTDYFSDFTADQPDFCGMRRLAEEAMLAAGYAKRDYDPDVYVRYPYTSAAKSLRTDKDDWPFSCLLSRLNHHQISWKYADEGEDTGGRPVIEYTEDRIYTVNGIPMEDTEALCAALPHRVTVTDKDGNRPEGIFVRRFRDGGVVVLNLCAPAGEYVVDGVPVRMETHGVLTYEGSPTAVEPAGWEPIDVPFAVKREEDNILRLMYVNGAEEAVIRCDTPMLLRFAVRRDTVVSLDGVGLAANEPAEALPGGLTELYRVTEAIALSAGDHTVRAEKDYKYLPAVLLLGDFDAEIRSAPIGQVTLTPRSKKYVPGEAIRDYGILRFEAEVAVPEGATAISLTGTSLYARLSINSELLGERICAPYGFPLPAGLGGRTVHLTVEQRSSIGPLFGDVDYWDKTTDVSQWRGTPSTGQTRFGFEARFWFENERSKEK